MSNPGRGSRWWLAALAVFCVSCGSDARTASQGCNADADCAAGLSCLGFATFAADGGCSVGAKACSRACAADTDCATLGASFKCFAGCGATKFCGKSL